MSKTTIFYYPRVSSISEDGTITMRATGFDGDFRWTGKQESKPSDGDYEFWKFVISVIGRYPHVINDKEIEGLKEDYEANDFTTQ